MSTDTVILILGCIGIFGLSALAGGFITNLSAGRPDPLSPVVCIMGIIGSFALIAAFLVSMITGR
jgi:hypothetical protein